MLKKSWFFKNKIAGKTHLTKCTTRFVRFLFFFLIFDCGGHGAVIETKEQERETKTTKKTDGKDEHNTLKENTKKKNATQLICSKGLVYQNVAWATLKPKATMFRQSRHKKIGVSSSQKRRMQVCGNIKEGGI